MTTRTKKPKKKKPERRWISVHKEYGWYGVVFEEGVTFAEARRWASRGYRIARVEIREVAK